MSFIRIFYDSELPFYFNDLLASPILKPLL
jgi:hypothetical protein